jgi:hypothetical protein
MVGLAALAALIIIIMAGSALFRSTLENPRLFFVEPPIQKNSELKLTPGEQYRYSYLLNNTPVNLTYIILADSGCTRVRVLENLNDSGVCLDRWGNDESGFNSTYENPSILLFKPWMLALEEGWRWNSTMYVQYSGGRQYVTDTYYRVVRLENYSGRESFIVEIKSKEGDIEYYWIDAEKRVLLKIEGKGYLVELVD